MNLLALASSLESIVPSRTLNLLYIILDSIFLVVFLVLLLLKRKYLTVSIAAFGGILYWVVDYVFFYHVSGSRVLTISGVEAEEWQYAIYLLWHELSSGFTNFALIWLCLSKDKNLKEWLILVFGWWLVCPAIAEIGGERIIATARTTTAYHAPMAIITVVGYILIIAYNLFGKKGWPKANILYLLLVGVGIQAVWEGAFLLYGIRPWNDSAIQTWIVDSLIETNLGMPFFYFIHLFLSKKVSEDFSRSGNLKEQTEVA